MTFVLEIEYLAGVSFAAIGPDSPTPDWPPQPDRIFSALVATWAARGQLREEEEALKWLEALPPPRILKREGEPRTDAIVFVPPNDPRSNRRKTAKGVIPSLRTRQRRRFPATRPVDPVIQLYWSAAAPDATMLDALNRLARDTAYVGHSSSLTRCLFLVEVDASSLSETIAAQRRVYPGRLQELRETYAHFEKSANKKDRPQKGALSKREQPTRLSRPNVFADRWLLLEHVDGDMPDLRACALVARAIRDALLSGFNRIGLGDQIPEIISGHTPDRSPSRSPHVAIIPLAFAGFPYADGHVLGFGLVPPTESTILEDEDFREALRGVAPVNDEHGRRILDVTTKEGTPREHSFSIRLSPSFEAGRRSLDPSLYTSRARTFATVTPIALDRHTKEKGDDRQHEITAQITTACRYVGVAEATEIVADKHSAIEGAPSAYPSARAPSWTRWRLPPSLASRQLTHAVLRFAEPVDGPIILGAGRYLGLGLCRPLDPENG
jgi:CRISPR-associated protein Csb2